MKLADQKADLVLLGGNVITVDKSFSIAQAVAAKNGIIVAVGSGEEIRDLIGTDTEVLNVEGKTVAPGFNDSHMHYKNSLLILLSRQKICACELLKEAGFV